MTRAEVVAIARGWKGTPYVLGASVKGPAGGVDCVSLVRAVWCEVTGFAPPPLPPYRPDWSAGRQGLALLSAARDWLEDAPLPGAPGDVVALRMGPRASHSGILACPRTLIHAVEVAGVVEVPLAALSASIVAAFSFPGLED